MTPPAMRLGRWHQTYLYASGSLLVLSGALWLLFHYFVRIQGPFGEGPHPLEKWWLCAHGLCAAIFLIGFGSVMPGHVRRAWAGRRNRISGAFFFTLLAILMGTGYGLYYLGDESTRSTVSTVHWMIGLGIPVLMGWHIWLGRASRPHKLSPVTDAAMIPQAESQQDLRLIRKR
ncbi:MAG: hypothetical protein ABI648_06715 [Betaproteobacteria bacterium]|jgi:hypothetical protein